MISSGCCQSGEEAVCDCGVWLVPIYTNIMSCFVEDLNNQRSGSCLELLYDPSGVVVMSQLMIGVQLTGAAGGFPFAGSARGDVSGSLDQLLQAGSSDFYFLFGQESCSDDVCICFVPSSPMESVLFLVSIVCRDSFFKGCQHCSPRAWSPKAAVQRLSHGGVSSARIHCQVFGDECICH